MTITSIEATPKDQTQALSLHQMRTIVDRLAAAKSQQDVEAALKIYHGDAVLESPPFGSHYRGTARLRAALQAFFKLAPDYEVDLPHMAADGDTLCGWGTVRFTLGLTFSGAKPNGRRVSTPVFILFRFKDERVAWESFNFDLADVARQSGVPSESLSRG